MSYFTGVIFYIFSDLMTYDIMEDVGNGKRRDFAPYTDGHHHGFINYNFQNDNSAKDRMIILTYFAFTSLTTVGFGDYSAKADEERLFMCVVLLFGVAIFSYVMGNFVETLTQFRLIN